jgi:hypothetical protein
VTSGGTAFAAPARCAGVAGDDRAGSYDVFASKETAAPAEDLTAE